MREKVEYLTVGLLDIANLRFQSYLNSKFSYILVATSYTTKSQKIPRKLNQAENFGTSFSHFNVL